ncbi:toll/interleukin-1 receptor domain-containing protein [Azohydromonas australica]|uniref:toll/interleukin-1 receptor domain-containing protein n=1 Tax=Azohydromonas australica TaxID=364039 RepID=UPI0004181C89|nr:toll/interleukin-1 receptor domain-containing protein [Azohydromonas australica]
MSDVFISYRRQDSPAATGRLADRLYAAFGADRVFLDVGDIVPGANFVQALEHALAGATVVLALVGPGWLRAAANNGRRLDDPDDFVRREIELALAHGKPVIPILLDGAQMPKAQELPPSLQDFTSCQAVVLANDRWDADTSALIDVLASQYGITPGVSHGRHASAWWHKPVELATDLVELLVHPRALIVRRLGSGAAIGAYSLLLRALAMLVLCLALGNLLLGVASQGPPQRWLVPGLTLGLLMAVALSAVLAGAWRVVQRVPCWSRVATPFAYLFGGTWLYFCTGTFVMLFGVELVQPQVLQDFIAQASHAGTDALPTVSVPLMRAVHGPALVTVAIGSAVWLAGIAWCVRGWAVFRIALGAGRLAAAVAFLLWVALLAGLCALAWQAAT